MAKKKVSSKRMIGEHMNNPMADVGMREVNMLDEAMKDGAHVLKNMDMMPKKPSS